MSKFLIAVSLLLLSFGAVATEGDFKGSYRVRVNNGLGSGSIADSFNTSVGDLNIRTYFAGKFKPSESVEAKVGSYIVYDGTVEAIVPFGYANWMLTDEYTLKAGRTSYEIADGAVIGKNKYQDIPVLFDGLFLNGLYDSLSFDLAYVQVKSPFVAEADNTYYGIASFDIMSIIPDYLEEINVHAVVVSDSQARFGGTVGGMKLGVGYKATVAYDNTNDSEDGVNNLLVNAKLAYKYKWDDQKVKVWVGAHYDGENYDAFLYDRHKYAGAIDLVNLGGGLQYGYAGVMWGNSSWSLGANGYYFQEVASVDESSPISVDSGSMEVDVFVKKQFNSSVYGKLWAASLKNSAGEYVSKVEAQAKMKF